MLICGHFMVHRSQFFDLALSLDHGGPHDVESFESAVDKVRSTLKSIVGLESNLESVEDFLCSFSKFSYEESFLETEVDCLIGCKPLGITGDDKEGFLVVAFVSTYIKKLKRFVEFIEQFSFALVFDMQFKQLHRSLLDFSAAETHPIASCIRFLEGVFDMLLPWSCDSTEMNYTSYERRQQLEKLSPLMSLFGVICEYPEVWIYIKEMEWMGHEGLKRFYSEYDNVTQVLLGDSESYEMSLLDSMEPCVRVLSVVGGMREVPTVPDFFGKLLDSADVTTAIEQRAGRKIAQIHGRLSEIEDWFVNGVNELAGSNSFYVAACNNGLYSLNRQDNALCLGFTTTDDAVEQRLQGKELDDFIHQLTLVQNDQEGPASRVQTFIDQFQVLRRASASLLNLDSLGYSETSLFDDFVCRAGHPYIDQAKFLQKRAEQQVQKLNEWLRCIRSEHPLSLLFNTEELAKLYQFICARMSPESDVALDECTDIARHVSRIATYTATPVNSTLVQSTLEQVFEHALDPSWLVVASSLLSRIQARAGRVDFGNGGENSAIELHSLCCEKGGLLESQLAVLGRIYHVSSRKLRELL